MMPAFVIPQLADRAGWTLVHFLWQGALIAAVAAGILRLLSRRTAQVRYVIGVCALFLMIAVPVATFAFYAQAGSVLRGMMLRIATAMDPAVLSRAASATVLSPRNSQWTNWVVYLWFAGVALSSLRIVVGWRLTRRLLQTASDVVPESVKQTFAGMKQRMAFVRPVQLLLSDRIDGPAAIGWLRPVVLLPLTAITGLDPGQLQAVLAHELAHIRRHDFFVNVLQQCVESLLFYHPAVWWLSRRIRVEREHVCDDLAVAACGDPAVYARALVELERSRSNVPEMKGVPAVLVPDEHRDRFELFRAVTTGPNGRFTILGVPPGDYKVFAWESIETNGYFNPELLKRDEAKGQRIKIQDSDKATVTVKLIPGPPQ